MLLYLAKTGLSGKISWVSSYTREDVVTISSFLERSSFMEEDATLVTREQYIEMLIDASFRDASEMESGFVPWCEHHIPVWRKQGYGEIWIRQRIETAQISRGLHCQLKQQSLTVLEIRDELRKTYVEYPELYAIARERHPDLLRYRGNSSDLRQRYTLRIMIYETDKLAYDVSCKLKVDHPQI
jgi:hypothetical protein